jgi:hypothetical protein
MKRNGSTRRARPAAPPAALPEPVGAVPVPLTVRVYCRCTHSDRLHTGIAGDGYCMVCRESGCRAFTAAEEAA